MALIDVKEYYYTMLGQYIEAKEDLKDFERAFAEGYVTEDKLENVKEDLANIKNNLGRIQYIMYLFELPKKKKNKERFKANSALTKYFEENNLNTKAIQDENNSVLNHLRKELKNLSETK